MSTLKADTIQSTGGGAATLTKQAAAKHYVNYDAINQTTDDSLNQSSLTDVSTGEFYSTFTNAMDSATNKAHWASCLNSTDDGVNDRGGATRAGVHACIGMNDNHRALSASEVSFASYYGAYSSGDGALDDLSMTCCMTIGDLA